ncbi:putative signal peptide protein [Fibrella aestuarina BUZ 2]|uniref:Putative signal peptide protein n=1 Tax=Fibrella aestuarina BUZ 2 TaxID=1166018 RepID=I0KF64_9BACT|nr:hypothetical protein [Fibrella aestuarina]CCH02767.1 putative signal peptide protein [Fibrella aestuarina BUZ 2]
MKTTKLWAATVAVLLSVAAQAQTVDELVDKHIAAMGGLDKLNGVKTVVSESSLAVQGMEIPSKSVIVRGKSMRSESTVMGNSMVQVVDGTTGWKVMPAMMGGTGEPQDMTADELKQMTGQLDPFGALVNYKDKGYKVELVGKEPLDKKHDGYHLKITDKDGSTFDEWLDANTYLVAKIKRTMNGQTGEIGLDDYQDVQGIKVPKTMSIAGAMGSITMTTEKINFNAPVDESIFKKPAK